MKPTQPATVSSEFCGTDSCAVKHQSTSKTQTHRPGSLERTGTDFSAANHQSTSKLTYRPGSSSSEGTDADFSAVKLQSSRPHTDQPKSSDPTGTDSPVLHRSRKDSISSLSSEPDSEVSNCHWICMWKKASCQKTKTLLLMNRTSSSLRNKHTERQ